MKIGIVSDTHDNKEKVEKIFSKFEKSGIKLVIHLGDLISPFVLDWINENYTGKLILIRGNNDGELAFTLKKVERYGYEYHEDPEIIEAGGKRLAIMHKPVFLDDLVRSGRVEYVLYGHTHKKEIRKQDKAVIINPGESCGYLTGEATYVILDTETGEVSFERA